MPAYVENIQRKEENCLKKKKNLPPTLTHKQSHFAHSTTGRMLAAASVQGTDEH